MKPIKSGVTVTYEYDKWFDAPTGHDNDVVKVIRCKDCKHYNGLLYTLCPQSGMNVIDDEEDYCSWAEVKEE